MNIQTIGLIDDEDILLDLAALALSQLDHGDASVEAYLELLSDIEDRVCEGGKNAFLSSECAIVLSEVLNGELGFTGDPEGYDAPVNADFIRVLDRKRGLPIALAILYVAMARRAGWNASWGKATTGPSSAPPTRPTRRKAWPPRWWRSAESRPSAARACIISGRPPCSATPMRGNWRRPRPTNSMWRRCTGT